MNLTIRVLGAEVLHLSTAKADDDNAPGDVTTTGTHFGFVADDLTTDHKRATWIDNRKDGR